MKLRVTQITANSVTLDVTGFAPTVKPEPAAADTSSSMN
jgi:hypothetical protein